MPIALIADKCASHIFHKHVEGTEEGKAEAIILFFRSKEPGERNDSIDKKRAGRHILPKRKKTSGEIPTYLQANYGCGTFHTSTLASLLRTLQRYRRLQYAAFDRPWTKSSFVIFLLFIIFHNFHNFLLAYSPGLDPTRP